MKGLVGWLPNWLVIVCDCFVIWLVACRDVWLLGFGLQLLDWFVGWLVGC